MKGNRNLFFLLVVCVAAFLATLGAVPTTGGSERVRLGTPIKVNPIHNLPVLAGLQKGYWQREGLDLDYVAFEGGAQMDQAFAARALDLGLISGPGVILAIGKGVPSLIVAELNIDERFFIIVRPDSKIINPSDLREARIGVSRLGNLTHAYGQAVARALGIEKETKFLGLGGVLPAAAALKRGAVDGLIFSFYGINMEARGEARVLLDISSYLPKPWLGIVLFAHKQFVANKPELVTKAIRVLSRSTAYVKSDQAWAVKQMQSISGYSAKVAETVYKLLDYGPISRVNEAGLRNALEFIIKYGLLTAEKAPRLEDLYSPGLVPGP